MLGKGLSYYPSLLSLLSDHPSLQTNRHHPSNAISASPVVSFSLRAPKEWSSILKMFYCKTSCFIVSFFLCENKSRSHFRDLVGLFRSLISHVLDLHNFINGIVFLLLIIIPLRVVSVNLTNEHYT